MPSDTLSLVCELASDARPANRTAPQPRRQANGRSDYAIAVHRARLASEPNGARSRLSGGANHACERNDGAVHWSGTAL
jgi:hypothetical protein